MEKNSKIQPQTASEHQLIKPTQPTPCQRKFPSQYSADETLKIQGVGLCRATNKITGPLNNQCDVQKDTEKS